MKVEDLAEIIHSDFYTGVPDSQIKAFCNYLMNTYGIDPRRHIIAANEGNCVGLAAGYHLATGKVPVVYMQNSGEGNAINPEASLLNKEVYGIPIIFIIGWRGEPGVADEPQHTFQGKVTLKLLEDMDIEYCVISKDTVSEDVMRMMERFRVLLEQGRQTAFVIKKGALEYSEKIDYTNGNLLFREDIIRHIVDIAGDDLIVSTTGKTSRELFEIRENYGQEHGHDFLTVGSMGHSSSIALGVAIHKPDAKVWCIDGDGAVLMHMGAMAVIGGCAPKNMIHVVINNGAHESVGGQPTAAGKMELAAVAKACGYPDAVCVDNFGDLDKELERARQSGHLSMIEVKCAVGSREDLGRPTITTIENKKNFMEYLKLFR